MATTKTSIPAIDGWFTTDAAPQLLGSRCATCGTFAFPRARYSCPDPACDGTRFDGVPLGRRGRVWSFTVNRYQPPPPFIPRATPFEPFGIAAVELDEERIVVLGQLVPGAEVCVGDVVELVVDTLYEDEQHSYQIWKWRPAGGQGD